MRFNGKGNTEDCGNRDNNGNDESEDEHNEEEGYANGDEDLHENRILTVTMRTMMLIRWCCC